MAVATLERNKKVISEDDILYGVLEEEQVNLDPATGRWKIAKEVLEEMRKYLKAETGECLEVKIDKVKKSVKTAESDPLTKRLALRLEDPPQFTTELNKGKGLVFDYDGNIKNTKAVSSQSNPNKLMAASFQAHAALSTRSVPRQLLLCEGDNSYDTEGSFSSNFPTVNKDAIFSFKIAPSSSGEFKRRSGGRRRPPKATRLQRRKETLTLMDGGLEDHREGKQEVSSKKRKSESSFQHFAEMLNVCEMTELNGKGDRFTWAGKRWTKWIQCRLDRCFGNKAWHARFPNSNQTFLEKRGSDHRPVWVNLRSSPDIRRGQFRFDRRLLHHPDVRNQVETLWLKSVRAENVTSKIRKCRRNGSSRPYSCWFQWSEAAKAEVAIEYFSDLFSSSKPASYEAVFQSMIPKVTASMNDRLTSNMGARPSFAWRSLLHGRELLRKGIKWNIGDGANTNVWLDKWIDDPELGLRSPWIKNTSFENKRAWPWLIWRIWKNRNDFIFSGIRWEPEETQRKARLEADEWFLAQEVEDELGAKETKQATVVERRWSPPEHDWLMCNIGIDWVKKTKLVLLHSRRAFSNIGSLEEARWTVVLWAMESMTSLRLEKVVFAGEFKEIFMAVQKPHRYPALSFQVGEINRMLAGMMEFRLRYVGRAENRGASIIAQSVTREGRIHSYVAQGPPRWLFELFVNESRFL
ncbi:hypothetical protein Bca52824_007030 [Brassica carinata]|uniref:RNase H type-1 domain-containing protein n=1 Tax=Brassica carinata TaxID=52824 RepID=A0A8X7W763_BRACI|nr:hypothetical protein Bca52824_007030 [Brassica carinata]